MSIELGWDKISMSSADGARCWNYRLDSRNAENKQVEVVRMVIVHEKSKKNIYINDGVHGVIELTQIGRVSRKATQTFACSDETFQQRSD